VLSSNKEEIPKHQPESIESIEVSKPNNSPELETTTIDSESESTINDDSNTITSNEDYNYKIIIGRFSNENSIKRLQERLSDEGYHYFEELENGLTTVGVKIKSNPSMIRSQLQHFVDYYTWDSYFKKIK